jgi:hypothetical protein
MRKAVVALGCLLFAAIAPVLAGSEAREFHEKLAKDEQIRHALDRLTFGPRPGDEAQVRAIGLKKWLDRQLHPDRIPENPVLLEKLKMLDTLRMSPEELVRNYPTPQIVRLMVAGQMPFPADPERRRMIQKLSERFGKRQGNQGRAFDRADP